MKFCKIIIFNLLLLIILFLLLEFLAMAIEYCYEVFYVRPNLNKFFGESSEFVDISVKFSEYSKNYYDYIYFSADNFRPAEIHHTPGEGDKNAVVLLGCSFTYGDNLSEDETFSHILSEYTDRNVYNLGLSGGSPREMLYLLRSDYLRELVPTDEKVDYVIYTYIHDHIFRLFFNHRVHSPVFKQKDNSLEYVDWSIIRQSSFLLNAIRQVLVYKSPYIRQKMTTLENLYISEINREVKKKFNNAQMIVLNYWENEDMQPNWEQLEKEGIIVINIEKYFEDLHSEKYIVPDGHPNKKAWEEIVPIVSSVLENKN